MKKKIIGVILATAMVATLFTGCGSKTEEAAAPAEAAQEEAAPEAEDTAPAEAADAADATADAAGGDLASKKLGVCNYQFSDNFMTLFRTELENYLIAQGFSKDNITIVDGQNDQATQTGQIDNFINDKVDVLIINPVN